jgi:hypothetical protein
MVEYNLFNKINESIEMIVLIISYILCFVFINIENTEQISMYLFLILHILFLFVYYFFLQKTNGSILYFPYKINIPLFYIFTIGWIIILVSLSLMVHTFRILRGKYYPDPINLGRNISLKEFIKILWIATTVMLLVLYIFIKQNLVFSNLSFSINNPYFFIIGLSISMVLLSSLNVYLSYTFSKNQDIIVIPS